MMAQLIKEQLKERHPDCDQITERKVVWGEKEVVLYDVFVTAPDGTLLGWGQANNLNGLALARTANSHFLVAKEDAKDLPHAKTANDILHTYRMDQKGELVNVRSIPTLDKEPPATSALPKKIEEKYFLYEAPANAELLTKAQLDELVKLGKLDGVNKEDIAVLRLAAV